MVSQLKWLKKSLMICTVLCFFSPGFAQPLYQISLPDREILLYGTIHIKPETIALAPELLALLNEVDQVWFEIEAMELASAGLLMAQAAQRPNNDLQQQLGDELMLKLEQSLAELGLADFPYEQFESWFIANLMTMQKMMQLEFSSEYGSEQQLKALLGDQPINGLESVEQQLALFTKLQQELGEQELIKNSLDELKTVAQQSQVLLHLWLTADLDELDLLMQDSLTDYGYQIMLSDRNQAWLEQLLTPELADLQLLVAVGAGHLGGDQGLLRLFEQQGAIITALTAAAKQQAEQQ